AEDEFVDAKPADQDAADARRDFIASDLTGGRIAERAGVVVGERLTNAALRANLRPRSNGLTAFGTVLLVGSLGSRRRALGGCCRDDFRVRHLAAVAARRTFHRAARRRVFKELPASGACELDHGYL